MDPEIVNAIMALCIRYSIEYGDREGGLQPYEELMYKNACGVLRQHFRIVEHQLSDAHDQIYPVKEFDLEEGGSDSGTTTPSK